MARVFRLHEAAWEGDGVRVAPVGELVDDGSSRVAQPEEPCDLVVGFAGGVVKRGAQLAHGEADALDLEELGVPAGNEERDGVAKWRTLEVGHGDVPTEVVDPVERDAPGGGVGLGGRSADEEWPGKSRTDRRGDGIGAVDPGLFEGLVHDGAHGFEVGAGGDLRDDTAEAGVLVHGARHRVGADCQLSVVGELNDAYACLVAGTFNTEN